MLDGLSLLIGRQPDMEVVASATSGEEAVELFARYVPDVTLMDLQLPTMSGLEAIQTICREREGARIVVLTMYQGDEDIYRALEAGAAAYISEGRALGRSGVRHSGGSHGKAPDSL